MISIIKLPQVLEGRSRAFYLLITILSVWLISLLDYVTGPDIAMSLLYLFPISVAVWYVGKPYGYAVAAVSTMTWMIADLLGGAHYTSRPALYWNGIARMWVFFVIVWLISRLQTLQNGLESAIAERTAVLQKEITRREQLEEELLAATDRERERIGRELHDGMGQYLSAAVALSTSLEQQPGQDRTAVSRIAAAVKQAALESRHLARGLYPAELQLGGLSEAIEQLCRNVQAAHSIECQFVCLQPVIIEDPEPGIHLFRITQEAVNNAVKHARPQTVMVALTRENGQLTLIIQDDGMGMPAAPCRGPGTGLHTMAHRARLIGATLRITAESDGGTLITCALPLKQASAELVPEATGRA